MIWLQTTLSAQTTCTLPEKVVCMEHLTQNFKILEGNKSFSQWIAGGQMLPVAQSDDAPQYLIVCGTLTDDLTDQLYVFAEGSEIIFLNNSSELIVKSKAKLQFRTSYLHGCEHIWKDILVEPAGELEFMLNCRVEDAAAAVNLQPRSIFKSTTTTFNGNYMSIFSNGALPPTGSAIATMGANVFDGSKALLESYQVPDINNATCTVEYPVYGIAIKNQKLFTVGIVAGQPNVFQNFRESLNVFCPLPAYTPAGIISENCNLVVLNSRFENIANGSTSNTGGKALEFNVTPGTVRTLDFTGLGKDAIPTIQNVETGIVGIGNMKIRNAKFSDLNQAICFKGTPGPYTLTIMDNRFLDIRDHTVISDAISPVYKIDVRGNTFDDNSEFSGLTFSRTGLYLRSFFPGVQNSFIAGNEFINSPKSNPEFISHNRGVWIQNLAGATIEQNDFTDEFGTSTNRYEGINLNNSGSSLLSNDFIGAGNFNTHPSTGIVLQDSPDTWLQCNTADQTRVGVEVVGMNCDNARMEGNNLNTHKTGLLLHSDAIINTQPDRQNIWLGNGSNVEALFEGRNLTNSSDALFVQQSWFTIRNPANTDFWPVPRQVGGATDPGFWFFPQGGTSNLITCVQTGEPGPTVPGGNESSFLTETDNQVLANTYPPVRGYEGNTWEAKVRLFYRLNQHPALRPLGSAAATWYSNEENTTLGKLSATYLGIRTLCIYDETELATLKSAENYLENAKSEMLASHQALNNVWGNAFTTPATQQQLRATCLQKDSLLELAIQYYQTKESEVMNAHMNKALDLLGKLNAIPTTMSYESDFKTVCRIFLESYIAGAKPSGGNKNALKDIAHQCRYVGGLAVVYARAAIDDEWDYSAYDNCPDLNTERSTTSVQDVPFSLTPNPAQQSVLVHLGDQPAPGTVNLLDMKGQVLQTWQLTGTETQVNLHWNHSLPSGLYLIEIITTNQPLPQVLKLSIQQ